MTEKDTNAKEKAPLALDPEGTMPRLGEWVVLNEAAEILGVSRQHFYALARSYEWASMHRIGNSRTVVVHKSEVLRFKAARATGADTQKGDSSVE